MNMVEAGVTLTIVRIHWEGNSYQIKVGGVKDPDKQDIDTTYSTDSLEPNRIKFGKKEYNIDLSDVQNYRWLFDWIRERQTSGYFKGYPGLTIYKSKNGKVYPDRVYTGVFVEEISPEDDGDTFDVKLVASHKVVRDANNQFYSRLSR